MTGESEFPDGEMFFTGGDDGDGELSRSGGGGSDTERSGGCG